MQKRYLKINKGLSLVETVVYVGIVSVVLVAMVSAILFAMNTLKEVVASKEIKNAAISSLERITREVRKSEGIDLVSSVFDVHPGKLTLNTFDSGGSQTTIEFYLDDGIVKMNEGGNYIGDLTSRGASTTSFIFRNMSNFVSNGVKIEITIENEEQNRVENFYMSVVSRGSY